MLKKIFCFIKNNKSCLLLLLWPIQSVWYNILQLTFPYRNSIEIYIEADSKIPFCEWFILPYYMWYFYIVAVTVFFIFKNQEELKRLYIYMYIGIVPTLLLNTIIPTYFDRSRFMPALDNNNILQKLTDMIHSIDTPITVMPSMHVYVSIALGVAIIRTKTIKSIIPKFLCGTLTVLICLSTVFVKQHSLADLIVGAGISIPLYFFAYRFPLKNQAKSEALLTGSVINTNKVLSNKI